MCIGGGQGMAAVFEQSREGSWDAEALAFPHVVQGANRAIELECLPQLLARRSRGGTRPRIALPPGAARPPRPASRPPAAGSGRGNEVARDVRSDRFGPARRRVAAEGVHQLFTEAEARGRRRKQRQVDDGELRVDAATQGLEQVVGESDGGLASRRYREHVRARREHEAHGLDFIVGSARCQSSFHIGDCAGGVTLGQAHLGAEAVDLPGDDSANPSAIAARKSSAIR